MPPVEYFAAAASGIAVSGLGQGNAGGVEPSALLVEACGTYQKQSYRNRCHILSASGKCALSFPVVHSRAGEKIPIKEVKVDYSVPWTRQHRRAIESAYGSSAYFEYYRDSLFAILDSRPETLWELNRALLIFFLKSFGIPAEIRDTDSFVRPDGVCPDGVWAGLPFAGSVGAADLRDAIHPKRPNDILSRTDAEKPYFQVFSGKYGFVSNLSALDLLFNEGPDGLFSLMRG